MAAKVVDARKLWEIKSSTFGGFPTAAESAPAHYRSASGTAGPAMVEIKVAMLMLRGAQVIGVHLMT